MKSARDDESQKSADKNKRQTTAVTPPVQRLVVRDNVDVFGRRYAGMLPVKPTIQQKLVYFRSRGAAAWKMAGSRGAHAIHGITQCPVKRAITQS